MKTTKKLFFILVPAVLLSVGLIVFLGFMLSPYRRIEYFVKRHEAALTKIAQTELSGSHQHKSDEKFHGVEIDGVFEGDHPMVQFYSFGFGLVPSSSYYGFYYSPDDVPLPFQNADEFRVISGSDDAADPDTTRFRGVGDNGCEVKRILPCWYYYNAWF